MVTTFSFISIIFSIQHCALWSVEYCNNYITRLKQVLCLPKLYYLYIILMWMTTLSNSMKKSKLTSTCALIKRLKMMCLLYICLFYCIFILILVTCKSLLQIERSATMLWSPTPFYKQRRVGMQNKNKQHRGRVKCIIRGWCRRSVRYSGNTHHVFIGFGLNLN